ncbi:MAG: hypothetical protein JO234_11940 [Hyphomicrobiales bacterium]|nr:hypothetical protein [Hyphomicrobiales bacterium]
MVAAMIALAYNYVHKRLPGPRNPAASEAADYFWRYVTPMLPRNIPREKVISRGEDPHTKWRPHFETALSQNPILGSSHDEFERHLRTGRDLAKRQEAETQNDAPAETTTAAVAKREGRRRRAKA